MGYTIRNVQISDIDKLFEMMTALDSETKYMMYEPGERGDDKSILTTNVQAAVCGRDLLLVAEKDSEIVGYIAAQRGAENRIRHTAYIVVGIRQKHRQQGIGTRFFAELDRWARAAGIKRLELTVMCSNDNARALYEKSGFRIEGVREKSMNVDGHLVDEYYMAKLI